jgi:hypothetical protein
MHATIPHVFSQLSGSNIPITGASGFLGSFIADTRWHRRPAPDPATRRVAEDCCAMAQVCKQSPPGRVLHLPEHEPDDCGEDQVGVVEGR